MKCQKCNKTFPLVTIRNARHPNPLGTGHLCSACYQPYLSVLETYTTNAEAAATDPKAAAWTALCCLLAARTINLVHTFTAVLCDIVETTHSGEACRRKAVELVQNALSMLGPNANGQIFLQALLNEAKKIAEPSKRQITIQKYGSVLGDHIAAIEYEAVKRSGVTIGELSVFAKSFPGNEWLLEK